jgi:apoptosis-inducing factor 3
MSGEPQLSGPDLTQGVALAQIGDGAAGSPDAQGAHDADGVAASRRCLVGHAHGEPVLLARVGDQVFAVAANCTHYGGPLADGLVVGDTVRCPWHHACFSLRTGDALHAPALNPLPRYRVERQGDRVFVREKLAPAAAAQPAAGAPAPPSSIVIVGGGAAGNAAAQRLRHLGYDGPLTLLSADEAAPYDRPNLSKDFLAGNAPEEWIPLHPRELYEELRIDLRLGARVTAVDPQGKSVTLADGATLPFGALLLATGAEPMRLELPGANLPHVFTLRSLADSRALIAKIEALRGAGPAPRAVVVGASFIGLEVAAALRAREVAVTVVAPGAAPLQHVLGAEVGAWVRGLHEEHGVAFRLGARPAAIDAAAVTLEGGERLPADLVVMGVGVRPAVALAEAAGLAVDHGVTVDEYLETSAPGIFAAGDIARWPDAYSGERMRVEHWVVAERQGQTAAANMLGRRQRFDAAPFFWSQHYDVQVSYVGHAAAGDVQASVAGSLADRDAAVAYRQGGRLRAVATVFRDHQSLEVELAMERGDA